MTAVRRRRFLASRNLLSSIRTCLLLGAFAQAAFASQGSEGQLPDFLATASAHGRDGAADGGHSQALAQFVGSADAATASGSSALPPCEVLLATTWPSTPVARRALLRQMDLARPQCIGVAAFLALLGALWAEEGEHEQALVWLERALMLDPGLQGAEVDHALTLAALGEPAAATALALAWRDRTDLPPAVSRKLQQVLIAATALANHQNAQPRWFRQRALSLVTGYETNLDNSPRLSELTLTVPGGDITLPVVGEPRRGAAQLADASWQVAYSPEPGQVWRTGLNLGARRSATQPTTDWHQIQWAASGSKQWPLWRMQVEAAAAQVGGPLNEPYRVLHLGASVDRQAWGCKWRMGADVDERRQRATTSANANIFSVSGSAQCLVPSAPRFSWTAAAVAALDQATDPDRPGGDQRQWFLRLRLSGPVGLDTKIDLGLRLGQTVDQSGYSPLLGNNARRRLLMPQISMELSRPLRIDGWVGTELLAQLHASRTKSNLPLFSHSGVSGYAGLRWTW